MSVLPVRNVARLVVLDSQHSVLLVRYDDGRPGRPVSYWTTPGGAIESDETVHEAASRELLEETGFVAPIGRELWERRFELELACGRVLQFERFFLVQLDAASPSAVNSSLEDIAEHRWWTLDALNKTSEVLFPKDLASAVGKVLL